LPINGEASAMPSPPTERTMENVVRDIPNSLVTGTRNKLWREFTIENAENIIKKLVNTIYQP